MPEGSVRNFDEISDRLDQIIATVRSKDTSLERSLDLLTRRLSWAPARSTWSISLS